MVGAAKLGDAKRKGFDRAGVCTARADVAELGKAGPLGCVMGERHIGEDFGEPEARAEFGGGALTKSAHAGLGVGGTIIYFGVEDCAVQQARVAEAGGVVVRPKFSIGEFGFVVLVQDTEGNMIGFNSMK